MNSLSWVGKLPTYSDYIQSRNLANVERLFIQWCANGQQHVGEQMLSSEYLERRVYYFVVHRKDDLDQIYPIHGLLFTSEDAKGRICPFIVFAKQEQRNPTSIVPYIKDCFEHLSFDTRSLITTMTTEEFLEKLYANLLTINEDEMLPNKHSWVEIYPKPNYLFLSVDDFSPILYRKLIHR